MCIRDSYYHALRMIDAVIAPGEHGHIDRVRAVARQLVYLDNVPLKEEVEALKEIEGKTKVRHACCVGSLTHERGITALTDAMEYVSGSLLLAGSFSSNEYKLSLERRPGYKNIDYLGSLCREEVIELLKRSSVGVSTLLNVGQYATISNLPTKVYEYMAAGLPVVLSKTEYTKKIVSENAFAILVDPSDPKQIAEAINQLFDNFELASTMGLVGRKLVENKYNWSIEEMKLFRLYEQLNTNCS